ncbi:HET-domain-containing protein, partial [Acephala macrosclerotiorum]
MASPYVPLDKATKQIRLLVLSPSLHPDDERIQCQICIESNFEAVSFEALSYMWGDPDTAGNKVWLNNTLVDVRVNLYNALSYLRTNLERVLWIDALCINQDDVKERNHQVSFMGLVYEKATRVLVWLG